LTQPNGKVLHTICSKSSLSKTWSWFFEILTVRGATADASSYGFWTDIHVQSS